jgi:class 3 adenylate cyclase
VGRLIALAVPGTVAGVWAALSAYWTGRGLDRNDVQPILAAAYATGDADAIWLATWNALLWTTTSGDEVRDLLERAERAGPGRPRYQGSGWYSAGGAFLRLGEREEGERLLQRVIEAADRFRDPLVKAWGAVSEMLIAALDGRLETAVERAASLPGETGKLATLIAAMRPFLYLGRAREYIDHYYIPFRDRSVEVPRWSVNYLAAVGETEWAKRNLAIPAGPWQLSGELNALEGAILLGDRPEVESIAAEVEAQKTPTTGMLWLTVPDRHLAAAYAFLGRPEQALEANRAAEAIATRMRFRPEVAIVRLQIAEVLLVHYPADRVNALEHLDFALNEFREMKMAYYIERAVRLKMEAAGADDGEPSTSIAAVTQAVQIERPDLARRAAPDGTVTILFSDIEGSTALNVELGDEGWMELLEEHNRLVRESIARHRGFEVKTEGDAFMVAFQSARDGLRCATDIQAALTQRNETADLPVRVRIGLHTGEPVRQGDDFYGTHVVLAARIAAQAAGGDVLASALLRELVAGSREFVLTPRPPTALKGLPGEHTVYTVQRGATP